MFMRKLSATLVRHKNTNLLVVNKANYCFPLRFISAGEASLQKNGGQKRHRDKSSDNGNDKKTTPKQGNIAFVCIVLLYPYTYLLVNTKH